MEQNPFPEFNWGDEESRLRRLANAMLRLVAKVAKVTFRHRPQDSRNVEELFDPSHNGRPPQDDIE